MTLSTLPFTLETPLERRIAADPEWQRGLGYGRPRRGHPEGAVQFHIRDVLANVEDFESKSSLRRNLRLIALIHDTFKYQVDRNLPKVGANSHEWLARKFAERYVADSRILTVLELHDTPFKLRRFNPPGVADRRAAALIGRLGPALPLFVRFYFCDNLTAGKDQDHLYWFVGLVASYGL